MTNQTPLWKPERDTRESSRLRLFISETSSLHALREDADFESFHRWSIEHTEDFWQSWLRHSGLVFEGAEKPVFVPNPSGDFFGGRWFPQLKINFAENLLARLCAVPLVGLNEFGFKQEIRADELRQRVARLQAALRDLGVGPGDRVAGIVSNRVEAVEAMLATTSLGAVWSSCSPDFGEQAILDRFEQIEPKVLFVVDEYAYGGKVISVTQKNRLIASKLKSLKAVVEIGSSTADFLNYKSLVEDSTKSPALGFNRIAFGEPVFIMFSSGTTGAPKSLVHTVGGVLLQLSKEHQLHCEIKPNEKILYYTTCGWMMWNWLVAALHAGASVHCFDGSPLVKDFSIWDLVEKEKINVFGTSAKFISVCRGSELRPLEKNTFRCLRSVLSTGSPLAPEDFDYFYKCVSPDGRIQLSSISGGTDILSCFMLGTALKPVYRGEIQARGLGLDVRAFNDEGRTVVGERGELVCAKPFPSMPSGFYRDDGAQSKFRAAYFERFPGVWHHGDFVTVTPAGGIVIHGRSDATLNPGGVRIGTAEIYRQVETHPAVADSLVVGQSWKNDERVLLFVKLREGHALTSELEEELRLRIRTGASPRHVPALIRQVADIPYTTNGKKVEIAVKKILHGEEPKNVGALANASSLDIYRKLRGDL